MSKRTLRTSSPVRADGIRDTGVPPLRGDTPYSGLQINEVQGVQGSAPCVEVAPPHPIPSPSKNR